MTREEEIKFIDKYIKKNGVTPCPVDERGPDFVAISAWGTNRKKKKKRGRPKNK